MKRELLFYVGLGYISVLVPKKRGGGYLKVPCGHHVDKKLADAIDRAGAPSDICGLDGSLYINMHKRQGPRPLLAPLMKELSSHYDCEAREVNITEYWDNHPLDVWRNLSSEGLYTHR